MRAARGRWWGESRLQWPEPTRRVHLEGFLDLPVHGLEVGPRGSGVRAREAREENNLCGTADKAERCGPILAVRKEGSRTQRRGGDQGS